MTMGNGRAAAWTLALILFTSVLTTAQPAMAAPAKIMLIGNSVTEGDGGYHTYRCYLSHSLGGHDFDFVGGKSGVRLGRVDECPFVHDEDHEAYWGLRADQVLTNSAPAIASELPDIAIIHLGFNDVIQNQQNPGSNPVASTKEELRGVINNLRAANPAVVILLAQIVGCGPGLSACDAGFLAELASLNSAIADLGSEEGVEVVDIGGLIDYDVDLRDGVHPNPNGDKKVADGFLAALLPFLPPALVSTPPRAALTPQAGGSLDSTPVVLDTNDATSASYSVTADLPGWLSVSPMNGSTPQSLTVTADAGGLVAGNLYSHSVTVTSPGHAASIIDVSFLVPPAGGAVDFLSSPPETTGLIAFGQSQDVSGVAEVLDGGSTLRITGNGWKSVDFPYMVTPDTVLEFDFSSSAQGEIHGIGFDSSPYHEPNRTFQVYGTQNWGIQSFHDYVSGTTRYVIPVGTFYTGTFDRLFFVNDHDVASPTAESIFSNVVIYEGTASPGLVVDQDPVAFSVPEGSGPVSDVVTVSTSDAVAASFTVTQDLPAWLSVTPGSGSTPQVLTVEADPGVSGVGTFNHTVTVTSPSHDPVTFDVELVVSGSPPSGAIDFRTVSITSYGGGQDVSGVATVLGANGETLQITGNGWKDIPFNYSVTPDTVLEFDFSSSAQGEIQGIGFDTDEVISSNLTFQVFGIQSNFGIQSFHDYVSGTTRYVIPVGTFYTGTFDRLFFVNDHDVASPTAESIFSNVVIYEGTS